MFDLKGVTFAYIKDVKNEENKKKDNAIKNIFKNKKVSPANNSKTESKFEKVIYSAEKDKMQG